MKFLVFIAPKDFKDETLTMIRTFFDRWGVQYTITSYSNKECVGYHGALCKPDINAGKVSTLDYDGIILVDGKGIEDYRLFEYRPLLDMLLQFNEKKKMIGAVSNAIKIVARANIIRDKKVSMPDDEETKRLILLFHGVPSDNAVEVSGNIVTIGSSSGLETPLQEMLQQMGIM
jgi:putative intracellular protease/amidase